MATMNKKDRKANYQEIIGMLLRGESALATYKLVLMCGSDVGLFYMVDDKALSHFDAKLLLVELAYAQNAAVTHEADMINECCSGEAAQFTHQGLYDAMFGEVKND